MKRYLTINEAAEILDTDICDIYTLMELGELSYINNGDQTLLFYSDVEDICYSKMFEPWNAKYNRRYDY